MRSRGSKAASTRERILDLAIDLFSQRGYHGASIRDIAGKVGIKESSIYNHFKGKEEILTTIYALLQSEMDRTTLPEEEFKEQLDSYTREELWWKALASFTTLTEQPRTEKMFQIILLEMFRDERARDIALNMFFKKPEEKAEHIFKILKKKEPMKPIPPDFLASAYSYALISMRIEYYLRKTWGLDTEEVETKMKNQLRTIILLV